VQNTLRIYDNQLKLFELLHLKIRTQSLYFIK